MDRLPLVSSMIINVDQDVDEDWILEVIGHDGKAYNVTQKPGDLVLYESHSIIHGRPFPLKGRYYANIFIHFAPLTAIKDGVASAHDDLSGSLTAEDTGMKGESAADAAARGNVASLQEIAEKNRSLLFQADQNLWQPIHEAARYGQVHVIDYLVKEGADVNALTYYNETVLDIALSNKGKDNPAVQKLRDLGAVASGQAVDYSEEAEEEEEEEEEVGEVEDDEEEYEDVQETISDEF